MKKTISLIFIFLVLVGSSFAISQQEIQQAETLITANKECSNLTDQELELIGEYYMERMHPGRIHEIMHERMGLKEGSDAEKQFHIALAQRIYCYASSSVDGMMGNNMMQW